MKLSEAARDPFAIATPAAAEPKQVAPPSPQVTVAPPPPTPPPLNVTYVGRMRAPDGKVMVFGVQGNQTISLSPGIQLPNGYRVTEVSESEVKFEYQPLQTTAQLPIPPAPPLEIR